MDPFFKAYLEAALWSSTDGNEVPLDRNYTIENIAINTRILMALDCIKFQAVNRAFLALAYTLYKSDKCESWTVEEQAGHDFWLTRNGHGVGFWDRGLGKIGDLLTDACGEMGSFDLFVGDSGMISH